MVGEPGGLKGEMIHLAVVCRGRYGLVALAVVQGDIGQVGDVSVLGFYECHLHILAAVVGIAESAFVLLQGIDDDFTAIERSVQVNHWNIGLCDDGLQHLCTLGDSLRKWFLGTGRGSSLCLVVLLPISMH